MRFDGLARDVQIARQLVVRSACNEAGDDLVFSRGQGQPCTMNRPSDVIGRITFVATRAAAGPDRRVNAQAVSTRL